MASNDNNKDVEYFNRWSQTYDDSWIQRYADRVHSEMLELVANEIAHVQVPSSTICLADTRCQGIRPILSNIGQF